MRRYAGKKTNQGDCDQKTIGRGLLQPIKQTAIAITDNFPAAVYAWATSFGFSSSRGMIVNFRRAGIVPVCSGVVSVVTLMEKSTGFKWPRAR
jgi:hypothetical protein